MEGGATSELLAGLADGDIPPLVDELAAARLIEPCVTLTFHHPLVRAAVVADLGPGERAAAHRRAALLLSDAGADPDWVVPHILAAEPVGDPRIVRLLREAAARAVIRGAPDMAARFLRRALMEPPNGADRVGPLLDLGTAQTQAELPGAVDRLTEAVDLCEDPVARGRASLALARALLLAGRLGEVVDVCWDAADRLKGRDPDLILELDVELIGAGRQSAMHRAQALRVLADYADVQPTSLSRCMLLANLAVEEVARLGSRARTVELAERALVGGRLLDPRAEAALPFALYALTMAGSMRRALHLCEEVLVRHRADGRVQSCAIATAFRGFAAHQLGDVTAAVDDSVAALHLARTHGGAFIEPFAVAWLVEALIDVGEVDAASGELVGWADFVADGRQFAAVRLMAARGRLRLAQGRCAEAVADLHETARQLAAWRTGNPWLCPWTGQLALALLAVGRRIQALEVACAALDRARRWGAPFALAESLRVSGIALGGPQGVALLRESVEVAEQEDLPLELARSLVALGGVTRRAGSRKEAQQLLRAALDRATRCGAHAVADAARAELVASGARPRRARTSGADALTHAERRVAVMAARGATNREIAQALFVTEKTVETHLGQTYRKLGISARSQLAKPLGLQA